jgi:hypothetical protein
MIGEGDCQVSTCFMLVYCLVYSLTMKLEATCSSETSFDFQRTTGCYIPDVELFMTTDVRPSNRISCGGGEEYIHRNPAGRRGRRKRKAVPGDITGPVNCLPGSVSL